MLGTRVNVKAVISNPSTATSATVSLTSCTNWATDWVGSNVVLDSISDTISVQVLVPGNFPLNNIPEGKNNVQYIQVKVQYPDELVQPYELVQVTKESEKDMVVITKVGSFFLPDTTTAKEVAKTDALPVMAYYTNPENVESVQVTLTNSTNWATDWKSTSITLTAPFTGEIDTSLTIPEDFPIYNFPEGKNNIQYVQIKVKYTTASGLIQPYELVRVTGEAIIVESIEDYLTSLSVTLNEDTTKYMHSGWTVVGDRMPGDVFHFKGTYEVERNGHKATKVTIGILDFKGDWSGQNYGFSTDVANEIKGNLNGIIDYSVRIPHFFPKEYLVTDDPAVSNQLAQLRVTYDDDVQAPIKGGIYSNFWMEIYENPDAPSTCMDVAGVTLSEITGNSVKIDWEMGNDAAWDILVAEEGTIRNPDASEDFISVGAKPYVVGGLMPDTNYEMYIRTVCDNDTLNYKAGGYSEKMLFKTAGTTGTASFDDVSLNLYPNPVNDVLNINTDKAYNINVLDITGRVVINLEMTDNFERLNVTELNPGLYILRLSNGDKQISRKFIKE
jgi:hypothetical protein